MLTIEVEFLHGTFRATGADDLALAGLADTSEWPPSPARLYSALVAAGGTGGATLRAVPTGDALRLLEGEPPVIFATGSNGRCSTTLNPRFVVVDARAEGTVQNYPARKSQEVRPGSRVALADPFVRFVWPTVVASPEQVAELRSRALRVAYLGCSDSPVRVSVYEGAALPSGPMWCPDPAGSTTLPVPYEGLLGALDAAFESWTEGNPMRRAWIPNQLQAYSSPDRPPSRPTSGLSGVWIRFGRPVSYRLVRSVAETLRSAVLDHLARIVGVTDEIPPIVHGHGGLADHAYWVPLPWVGGDHADGRIVGAAVLLPSAADQRCHGLVREAAARIATLAMPGVFSTGVALFDGSRRPWSSNPERWSTPSRYWRSAFPMVQERFTSGSPDPTEVERWFRFAGLPEGVSIVDVRMTTVPLMRGPLPLSAKEVRRQDDRRPFSHIEVRFDTEIEGPLLVGSMRHFGLGLLAPVTGDGA